MTTFFKTLVFASDHAGYALKEMLMKEAEELQLDIVDVGAYSEQSSDYPDFAALGVKEILEGRAQGGVFVCGTGMGISMAANRRQGIRAALCNAGTTSARLTREHNDANVLCLGARLVGDEVAKDVLRVFLTTPFSGGDRHSRRIRKLDL